MWNTSRLKRARAYTRRMFATRLEHVGLTCELRLTRVFPFHGRGRRRAPRARNAHARRARSESAMQ
eukprot:3606942-Lingulodinium_polyedra.AAC.1